MGRQVRAGSTESARSVRKTRMLRLLAAVCVAALSPAACGGEEPASSGSDGAASEAAEYERALRDAPAPLAAIVAQQNELLEGGAQAFRQRLEELHGYPVVVNKWASWCGPCRHEFPFFQSQAAKHGERVAFLGVDSEDNDDAARTFLSEFPVPYPSYSDPDGDLADELGAEIEFPATIFIDADGEVAYVRRGGYASEEDLAADIQRYAR